MRIGDRSAEEAFQAIAPIVSHENEIWVREFSPNYLANADILEPFQIAPDNPPFASNCRDRADLPSCSTWPRSTPASPSPVPRLPTRGPDYPALAAAHQRKLLVHLHRILADPVRCLQRLRGQAGLPFAQFNQQVWAVFDSQPVEHFILDLRNNSGGNSQVFAPFLASMQARAPGFAQTPLLVIIGRRTFSSAIINAIQLRQGNVRFYGEPSGGSPNSYGEVLQFVLPNSRLSVNYSTKYFSFPGYPDGSLLPDVPVKIYSADYCARHDPFLAAALQGPALPRRPPPPTSAW